VDVSEALDAVVAKRQSRRKTRELRPLIARAERQLGTLFRKQGRLMAANLRLAAVFRESAESEAGDRAFDSAADATRPEMTAWAEETVGAAFEAALDATGVFLGIDSSFELPFPEAERYASRRSAELVRGLNATSRERMRGLVARAVEEGWSYDRLAKEIRLTFDGFAAARPQKHIQTRSHLVAVTEMGQAYEEGSAAIARTVQAAGVALEKAWLTAGDDRLESLCLSNEGAGWIDFDDPFPSGHMHPLAHPACRCTGLSRRKEDA